jgi:hypothetical protein
MPEYMTLCAATGIILLYVLSWYLWFLFFAKDKVEMLLLITILFLLAFYTLNFDVRGLLIWALFTINSIFWLFNE